MADSNSELVIIIPIIVIAILLALLFAIPLLARRYCYSCCDPEICGPCCAYTEFCMDCCKGTDERRKGPDRNVKVKEDYGYKQVPIAGGKRADDEHKNQIPPISDQTAWNDRGQVPTPRYVPPISTTSSVSKLDFSFDTISSEHKSAEVYKNGNSINRGEFRGRGSIPDTPQTAPVIYSEPERRTVPFISLPEEHPAFQDNASGGQNSVFDQSSSSRGSPNGSRRSESPVAVREFKSSPRYITSSFNGSTNTTEIATHTTLHESESREAERLPRRFQKTPEKTDVLVYDPKTFATRNEDDENEENQRKLDTTPRRPPTRPAPPKLDEWRRQKEPIIQYPPSGDELEEAVSRKYYNRDVKEVTRTTATYRRRELWEEDDFGKKSSEQLVVFESVASSKKRTGEPDESYVSEKGLRKEKESGVLQKSYDMSYHEYTV